MLVSSKKILDKANKGHYAVGAFNTNNLEITQAIIEAAIDLKAPVIIQTSEGAISYAGLEFLLAINKVASQAKVPVAIHLDHGKDLKLIKKCIDAGYTSVMYDGSSLPFAKNVSNTKKVVAWAHKKGVSVEAEIGALAGKEDFVSVSAKEASFTDPDQALDFVKKTKCDVLAIAIGTAHGALKFKGACHLDFKRLKQIKTKVKMPLVLHGASGVPGELVQMANKYGAKLGDTKGVPDSQIRQAILGGINKINTDTDLRIAFTAALRKTLKDNPAEFDPRKILGPAKELMKKVIMQRIRVFGAVNKG
ncbi:MAG: class II fructose-1,6-bisphosphate aldolase [Candidatus Parcubacteria bacterium]|nr:class II fructose-1,6-bisphosphate aldolase [Candidatus Parcubacteria bacterium]